MATVTTRPDATVDSTSTTVTGAATAHAALADDSDSSYVTITPASWLILGLAEVSLPAGAVWISYALRVRSAKTGDTADVYVARPYDPPGAKYGAITATWATPTTTVVFLEGRNSGVFLAEIQTEFLGHTNTAQIYALLLDTTYAAKPVTSVTAPTGTIAFTNLPTVTWANTLDSAGGAQTSAEVKIFSSAQYSAGGFDPSTSPAAYSGTVSGAATSKATTTVLAVGSYRAYVRVSQTIEGDAYQHTSDWDYEAFTVDLVPPNAPAITATAESSSGRIRINLDDAASGPSTDLFELQKSSDGGTTWESMRLLTDDDYLTPASGLATAYDYEAPNGVATYYRARALHDYGGAYGYAGSAWATANATWSSTSWWIKHPNRPALNFAVVPHSLGPISRTPRQGVFKVAGRSLPVIVEDSVRDGATGSVTFLLESEADRDAFAALLDTCDTLLLQGRAADYWTDRYVRFGQHDSVRVVDKSYAADTVETLPWTEVDSPAGVVEDWSA